MSQSIQHEGIVVSVDSDCVKVRIEQTSACRECQASSMCAASDKKDKYIDCQPQEPLQKGDRVMVTATGRMGFWAVLLAFVFPFCLLLGLVAMLDLWIEDEGIAGTVALCSLLPYYVVLALCKRRMKKHFVFYAHKV
ncbi:MAG TPA: hypothetical protein DIW30_07620 [Bacteroidales bacterium]|nr:hypothetical protein [Bacteroidales bacterium]